MEKKISFNDIDFTNQEEEVKTFEVEFLGKKYNINAVKRLSLKDEAEAVKAIVMGSLVQGNGAISISTEDPITIDELTEYNPSYANLSYATTILHMYTDIDFNNSNMDSVNLFVDTAKYGNKPFYYALCEYVEKNQINRIRSCVTEMCGMYKSEIESGLPYKRNICNAIDMFSAAMESIATASEDSTKDLKSAMTELSEISDSFSDVTKGDLASAMVETAK